MFDTTFISTLAQLGVRCECMNGVAINEDKPGTCVSWIGWLLLDRDGFDSNSKT